MRIVRPCYGVERQRERDGLAGSHQRRGSADMLRRNVVERSTFVFRPPPSPVVDAAENVFKICIREKRRFGQNLFHQFAPNLPKNFHPILDEKRRGTKSTREIMPRGPEGVGRIVDKPQMPDNARTCLQQSLRFVLVLFVSDLITLSKNCWDILSHDLLSRDILLRDILLLDTLSSESFPGAPLLLAPSFP